MAATGTDFERDPNQGSLEIVDLDGNRGKEKRYLLEELKVIKD